MIKLKLKRFWEKRINNPFGKSKYKSVKEAIEGMLNQFKKEFKGDISRLLEHQ